MLWMTGILFKNDWGEFLTRMEWNCNHSNCWAGNEDAVGGPCLPLSLTWQQDEKVGMDSFDLTDLIGPTVDRGSGDQPALCYSAERGAVTAGKKRDRGVRMIGWARARGKWKNPDQQSNLIPATPHENPCWFNSEAVEKSFHSGSFNSSGAQRPSQATQIWSPQRGRDDERTNKERDRTRRGHAASASN